MTRPMYRDCLNCHGLYDCTLKMVPLTLHHREYCPGCRDAILEALESVPKTAMVVHVDVGEPERSRVLAEYAKPLPTIDYLGPFFRMGGGALYKVMNGKTVATRTSRIVTMDNVDYTVNVWSDNSEPPQVTRRALRDLATGDLRYAVTEI